MSRWVLFLVGLAALLMAACSDDSKPVTKDVGVIKDLVAGKEAALPDRPKAKEAAVKPDKPIWPDVLPPADKQTVDFNMTMCKDTAALLNEALTSGKKAFNGVKLTTSTPIGDILANPAQYTGKVVRIEGFINEVCPWAGCYITLVDKSGKEMNLKVDDFTGVDFRTIARYGNYAVGEGLPSLTGEHGPEVYIQNYGAMVGNILCPVP